MRALPFVLTATLLSGLSTVSLHAQATATAEVEVAEDAGFESPQEAFEAAKTAFNERQWDVFLSCVSPEQQMPLVGQMAFACEQLQSRPGMDERVGQLLDRFFPKGIDTAAYTTASGKMQSDAFAELGQTLDDPAAFFGEATNLVMALEHGDQADQVQVGEIGDLQPYKTADGASDHAVQAQVTLVRPDTETPRRDIWRFVSVEKRWFLAPLGAE
ncbi:MAG: hypothetical protein V3V20_08750 [Algisphaera sp.]